MATLPAVYLKPGRERPLRLRHPWVLSGSVDRIDADAITGATVSVISAQGEVLGAGDLDLDSQIRVRVHTFGSDPPDPDERWVDRRIEVALGWRRDHPLLRDADAVRLLHAEGDGLPGLVCDRYGDWLVFKAGSPGMLRRVPAIAEKLAAETGARGAWLRGEGNPTLPSRAAPSRELLGEVPEKPIWIEERGRRYRVDLRRGQKTGFYLDQREARELTRQLAPGTRTLDLFSYSGGFSAAALQGGAREVVAVESSKPALELLRENVPQAESIGGNVGDFLRHETRRFDLVVCDPPPLARRRRDVSAACRAYKDLNLWMLRRAAPGAHVLTFTCSHHIEADLFRKVVFSAAIDARAEVQLLGTLCAAPDHPVALHHPQGEYLKGLLLRVVEPGQ